MFEHTFYFPIFFFAILYSAVYRGQAREAKIQKSEQTKKNFHRVYDEKRNEQTEME